MAYYLGIDGGGTKTRCVLGDKTTVMAKAMSGGSNIVRLGEAQAREALHAVVRQVIGTMVTDLLDTTRASLAALKPETVADIRKAKQPVAKFSFAMQQYLNVPPK